MDPVQQPVGPSNLIDYALIILPAAAYLDQARTINAKKDLGTFTPATCGVLIICNVLRVFYWMTASFSSVLLYQSVVMIATQLFLQNLCISVSRRSRRYSIVPHYRTVLEFMNHFWSWPHFRHYTLFLTFLSAALMILHFQIGHTSVYSNFLGAISLSIEASVPMPQAYSNWKRKSTYGLSWVVLLSWFGGDTFKIGYYMMSNAPLPFVACGLVQVGVDLVIGVQLVRYSAGTASMNRSGTKKGQEHSI